MDSYLSFAAAAISFYALFGTMFFNRKSSTSNHQENNTMASSSSSSLTLLAPTSSSSSPPSCKHHVFPSFHGADVRTNFLSHFVKELKSKGIDLFIDNDIERSKSIGTELVEAIKGSRIAIVLLSKNYASSTWCLKELVEIMMCREEFGQTVMPLFYQVDPTDVKKQTGDFGKVFKKACKGKTEDEIRSWKRALTEVAQIAGFHLSNGKTEAGMISAIATVVSNKLNLSAPCSDFDGLVGMESRMTELEPLLRLDSDEVRKIGIWGPSGIGKTTIARCLFNRHSQDFQLSVFIDNIKRKYEIPAYSDDYGVKLYLQKQFMSQLTNDTCVSVSHLGVVQDRLQDKKVLVVLDDVDQLEQVEAMAKETYWFGPGSRIIITTQDRRVLRASGVKHVHEVHLPSYREALQIFCMYAFGQKDPKDGFYELASEVSNLVGNLPLGLKVMGSYFRGMPEEYWIEALPGLKTHVDRDGKIAGVLKFSYDALNDEDKRLFLHIACFFNYEPIDMVEGCLENVLEDVRLGLHVLVEKSLISANYTYIRMTELLVQLGRKIVRDEYASEPWKRKFFDAGVDIGEVLSDGVDLYEDITGTSERAFEKWSNLQFLKVRLHYGVNLGSMNYLSQKLRVLIWQYFKMACFRSSFNPEFLVKLEMRHSKLVKFWEGIKPLKNLKWMDLSDSERLKELPDLSTATSLNELDLRNCSSLKELPYSIGNAINLNKLNLSSCSGLVTLPSSIGNATNLQDLNLSSCSGLVELPSSIGNAINLNKLNLSSCSGLVELPSSIGNATNLQDLNLSSCSGLVKLPSSIGNAINLNKLNLSSCSGLVELPSSIGNAINLNKLDLSSCSGLVELPSSIGNTTNLRDLNLIYCSSLTELPSSMINLGRLEVLGLQYCSKLEVNLANINWESLQDLDLSGCSLFKIYHESSTDTQELGPWVGRISRARRLVLRGMKKLVSLPQIPDWLTFLDASGCESLESLDCCTFRNPDISLFFINCYKLNQEARDLLIMTPTIASAVFPGEEVPQCFTYRSSGRSVTVKLNQMPLGKSAKFKACVIFPGEYFKDGYYCTCICCRITSGGNALTCWNETIRGVYPGHLYTFKVKVETEEVTSTELVFDFKLKRWTYEEKAPDPPTTRIYFKTCEVKECGILQFP